MVVHTNTAPSLFLHCQVKLQWKKCADMPVERTWAQAVVMREKVYVGGGVAVHEENLLQVFQYDPSQDKWSRLPLCQISCFALAQFKGNLITVGGLIPYGGGNTGKVYRFIEESQKWEEFLKSMPTARYYLSVATTQSAIVASGGNTADYMYCSTVEVYSSETSQWHTADPLPVPCGTMTSVTIADTWYQLGGSGGDHEGKSLATVFCAPLTALIQKATSPTDQSAGPTSVWKTLPDTPFTLSAAASLSGNLLSVGGSYGLDSISPAVYVFLPDTNSWVRVTNGDLPEPHYACAAVQLSSSRVLVVGGEGDQGTTNNALKSVYLGSTTS